MNKLLETVRCWRWLVWGGVHTLSKTLSSVVTAGDRTGADTGQGWKLHVRRTWVYFDRLKVVKDAIHSEQCRFLIILWSNAFGNSPFLSFRQWFACSEIAARVGRWWEIWTQSSGAHAIHWWVRGSDLVLSVEPSLSMQQSRGYCSAGSHGRKWNWCLPMNPSIRSHMQQNHQLFCFSWLIKQTRLW